MCLIMLKASKVRIARKDIPVYKFLVKQRRDWKENWKEGGLASPYHSGFEWKRGRMHVAMCPTPDGPDFAGKSVPCFDFIKEEVEDRIINNALHSYENKPHYGKYPNYYRMYIPKGTPYVRGACGELASIYLYFPRKGE